MSSLPPSTTERTIPSTPVRPAFDWIEVFAIPISFAIMETQPLVLFLSFCLLILIGPDTPLPLNPIGVTLLMLGLQWWTMFINHRLQHQRMSPRIATLLHLLAVACAFGLALWTQVALINLLTIVFTAGLVIFCWKRGIDKAKAGLADEQIMLVFKLGVGILLVVLSMSVLLPAMQPTVIFPMLASALPLFFLSGLLCLSFVRMGMIRHEHARQGIQQADPTQGWLLTLTFLWGVLVAGAFALETFSFNTIQALLLPILNIAIIVVSWVIYAVLWVIAAIFRLLNLLFRLPPLEVKSSSQPTQALNKPPLIADDTFPAWVFLLIKVLFVAILLVVLFVLFRVILRRMRPPIAQADEEEIREILSMRDILRQRRRERKQLAPQKEGPPLEELDPASARARYRALLLRMAAYDPRVGRQPEETPDEYQERLTALLEQSSDDTDNVAPDRLLLADLTHAYTSERYGGKHISLGQQATVYTWIAHLTERLAGSKQGARDKPVSTNTR